MGKQLILQKGKQKVILHQQNAVSADIGMMLDDSKKKRATRLKKSVSGCYQISDRRD